MSNRSIIVSSITVVLAGAFAAASLAQPQAQDSSSTVRKRNEVHLIVGDCTTAGMIDFEMPANANDEDRRSGLYIRIAGKDEPSEAGKVGGHSAIERKHLPTGQFPVVNAQTVDITGIVPPSGTGDTAWIQRGGNHTTRSDPSDLHATLNGGNQEGYHPRYLAVSICRER